MEPKISIIVPVYKSEACLETCVQSILKQSFSDFELILVNDGSPDSCGEMCEELSKKDKRIKVIHKKNGGAASARNAGLKRALGKYIAFVDSDDFIHYRMYECLYKVINENASDIAMCDFIKVSSNKKPACKIKVNGEVKLEHYSNLEALEQLYSNTSNLRLVIPVNKLYKKHLFKGLEFKEGRICEDEFIIHEILYASQKVSYINETFYFYLQRPNSVMNAPYSVKRLDKVHALKERVDFFQSIKQPRLANLALRGYIDSFFWNYFLAKTNLSNCDKELRELKRQFSQFRYYFIRNPLLSWKHKLAIFIFMFNSNWYKKIFLFENNV
ncbi:glycosyltransferase [Pullulanibacillus sp. KACC 23026]|uniref:glycosyltransferase family 2 protein n=1 Tax=Pullulanibacillus sp. KACC 23026 TaxID=3028315 RepID=UPI0023B1B20B|nr:glycosyltransferase [Pullulanibacillus sp. KACC 23026]WEG11506.1 glycosyltransferase [Pullulanibacillus sp. KACC 23026]